MRTLRRALLAAGLAAAGPAAGGIALDSPLAYLPGPEQRECEAMAEAYLRLAELRDVGADEAVAVNRGVDFLAGLGRTGSHYQGRNYRPAVTQFARVVYGRRDFRRTTLYLYGLSSCALAKLAPDDDRFAAAIRALEQGAARCQAEHPDAAQVRGLGACVLAPVNGTLEGWSRQAPASGGGP